MKKYEEFLKLQEQKDNDDWKPEIDPDEINLEDPEEIIDESDDIIETPDLSDQPEADETPQESPNENPDTPDTGGGKPAGGSQKTRDAIGRWGEKFVNNILKKNYPTNSGYTLKWLNRDGNVGKGYDFAILKNNEEILYIEVKSKKDENPKLISITGTQWEWARKLYDQNDGDKYKIYVVTNAGTENAKYRIITNPIKKWKDGKLKAHPVNFEL